MADQKFKQIINGVIIKCIAVKGEHLYPYVGFWPLVNHWNYWMVPMDKALQELFLEIW